MIHFSAKDCCPYPVKPCIALSRAETELYRSPDLSRITEKAELLAVIKASRQKRGFPAVIGFDRVIIHEGGRDA